MMQAWLPVVGALAVFSSPAFAADFENAAAVDWSGFYLGAHAGFIGADFNNDVPTFPGPTDEAGSFIGGAQLGYNWQSDSIVFGAEIDGSFIDLEGKSAGGRFQEDLMATARLRAGLAWSKYLVFLSAGIAGTDKEANLTGFSSDSEFVLGVAGGAGIEAMLGDNWSARVEYLYVNVPDDKLSSGGVSIVGGSDNHIIRAGLNLHF